MSDDRFRRAVKAGESVFQEGEAGACAYVIESGLIEIWKNPGGRRGVVATLEPGDIFGEMALIDDLPRSASATAVEPATLIVITREYLSDRVQESDPLMRHLMRVIIKRLRAALAAGRFPGEPPKPVAIVGAAEPSATDDRRVALERLDLVQAMQKGLEDGEFELHLQPIVRLPFGTPAGFEALIRWNRPGRGYVPPMEFIPVAEQSDLITKIGHWTIATACAHLHRFDDICEDSGLSPLFVGVNLSGRQFRDPQLFDVIAQALTANGILPERLKLEVTETLLIHNFDLAVSVLNRCKQIGLKLALDDFGTGYSSLSYLNRFPVDMLKIDRAFVKEVAKSDSTRKIVRAIAALGSDLGMDVLAEGMETGMEAEILSSLGVQYGQGWFFSKAITLDRALNYIQSHARTAALHQA
ncbi:MAG: EAL domain-containing protein [Gammaproteobacteria bacterium]|nr:EAL domain-containing protein [Gammaproteobacteria bacterium]